uniref:Dynein light chain n=2 Tax=Anas TaxID=8835 RepID=A0A8B9UVF6_9AVES
VCDHSEKEEQQDAVDCATQALAKHIEKGIANPTWHCITGRNCGSYVTPEIAILFESG